MKKTLLSLFLLTAVLGFSKTPPVKKIANPAIGVMLTNGFYLDQTTIGFTVKIKNIGEETLTNIYATQGDIFFPGGLSFFGTIDTMAPGEEITLQIVKVGALPCYDQEQIKIHATTALGNEITDLSADPTQYDNNGLPGSYYNDIITYTNSTSPMLNVYQEGVYNDANNNNIVDVGDVVDYTYSVQSFSGAIYNNCTIADNNAIIANPDFAITGALSYMTTGVHFITQADVDLGYVYNSSTLQSPEFCFFIYPFVDQSYCNGCPNPQGANVITRLGNLIPNRISGTVKFNANNDDCATGISYSNRRINTTDGTYNYVTYTNNSGNYEVTIPNSGLYETTALSSLNVGFSSYPTLQTISSSGDNQQYTNNNFCISSATNYADLRVNLFNVNQAIPGFAATYRLYYENLGTTNLSGSIVLSYEASTLNGMVAVPTENASTGNTLTWNYTNLLPFERRYIELSAMVFPPPVVNSGDINTLTLTGNPTADSNPANNTFVLNQTIVSSFDPNDKSVLEGATITASQATGYLNYVTRFQNTGTANATFVVVKEALDPDLDWNTFEPIDASHANNIQIKNGNELTYTFPNINLPYEAANEAGSHGWLAYRIKPKSSFAIGDVATSSSAIYFDFNLPILTNDVNTSIENLATAGFVKELFVVYPNPAKNFITIENKSNLNSQYEVVAANGQSLMKNDIENSKAIDISALQNGFYFINIKTSEGKATYKFIKN